jgi:HNH endonuclease
MKRVQKKTDSEILAKMLRYIVGNSANNKAISEILFNEQNGFCAYTEEYLGRADARDIEHFNPQLKDTEHDSYDNWFLVKHQPNKEKSSKWDKFQPVLHPTANDFEKRIIYDGGDYRVYSGADTEAKHLVELLNLDDAILADERKRYIKRKRDEMDKYGTGAKTFFQDLIEINLKQISYLRAIDEEFDISIVEMINDYKAGYDG